MFCFLTKELSLVGSASIYIKMGRGQVGDLGAFGVLVVISNLPTCVSSVYFSGVGIDIIFGQLLIFFSGSFVLVCGVWHSGTLGAGVFGVCISIFRY